VREREGGGGLKDFARINISFNLPAGTVFPSLYAFENCFKELKLLSMRHKETFYHRKISRDLYLQDSFHLIKLV
jgi:hypothetical protein